MQAVGGKLLGDQSAQFGSCPARFREQRDDTCERLDAARDYALEFLGCISLRKLHARLHDRQHVLGTVLGLASQSCQLCLFPLAPGNVTRNFGHPDDLTFGIPHWRRGERNLDQATVLALASGFIMVNALPAADAFENCRFLISAVGGEQQRDRLADRLCGGVAKKPFSALVPTGDPAMEVFAEDRIVGTIDDGSQIVSHLAVGGFTRQRSKLHFVFR